MDKFLLRVAAYFIAFALLSSAFGGISGTLPAMLLFALVLSAVNCSLRPVLTFIALPATLLTLGVASVFVNMLTLLIADAFVGSVHIYGFWLMALCCVAILAADALIRGMRHRGHRDSEA